MEEAPVNYPTLLGVQLQRTGDGLEASLSDARAFWQSRMTSAGSRPEPPELIDPEALARSIRESWQHGPREP
jgi:hypothetical protein